MESRDGFYELVCRGGNQGESECQQNKSWTESNRETTELPTAVAP